MGQEFKDALLLSHNDAIALRQASDETGIVAKLKATQAHSQAGYIEGGCRWYALSPRWLSEKEKKANITKYPVIYWLNPEFQHRTNCGWFTVENLEQWIEGKGPIPKTNKTQ